jgi:hypothetical protein
MPFTISHAAAVLPLRKLTRLPLAALAIGSMSPDFSYFFAHDDVERLATHSIAGLFWFCLPASLVVWFLYVRLLEAPSMALLPGAWAARITPSRSELTLARVSIVSAAILLGALTHLVWDAFTHIHSPVVNAVPGLRVVVFEWHGRPIRVFRLLQYLSSIAGLLILTIWAWLRVRAPSIPSLREAPSASASITNNLRVAALLVLVLATAAFAIWGYRLHPAISLERRLFYCAMGGMTGAALAWCALAAFVTWKTRSERTRG